MECVHHLTYARKYREQAEDLAGWCNACHDFTHGRIDKDPKIDWANELYAWISLQSEARPWMDLFFFIVLGSQIYDLMGKDWLLRAAKGEFKRKDRTDEELQEIVNRRRKQQGIT
jgi:hypothetical protein